jgi:serine/threonine protein kinase
MIMEFCGGGELYEFVKNEGRIDEVDARDIFR